MRLITQKAIEAFLSDRAFKRDNTRVDIEVGRTLLKLHNNTITIKKTLENGKKSLLVRDAGWKTNTTKERLNGLPNVSVLQSKHEWFLNGEPWDGSWTEVGIMH